MEKKQIRTAGSAKREASPIRSASFRLSFAAIFAIVLLAYGLQRFPPNFDDFFSPGTLICLAASLALATVLVRNLDTLYQLLTSARFAVVLVLFIGIATIIGTFVLQKAEPADYREYYGAGLSSLFNALFLTDVFHSLWFNCLLGVTAICLLLVIVKRKPFSPLQWGFLFSHLGVLLILAGALVGTVKGSRGAINLTEGTRRDRMVLLDGGSSTGEMMALGFGLQLDEFQVDHYPGKYRIYAYREKESPEKEENPYRIIASFAISEAREKKKIPGTDIHFRVTEETLEPKSSAEERTAHRLVLTASRREWEVEVGEGLDLGDGWHAMINNFFPHLSYDSARKEIINLSEVPVNPTLLLTLSRGSESRVLWLFSNAPDTPMMRGGEIEGMPFLHYVYDSSWKSPSVQLELETPGGKSSSHLRTQPFPPLVLEEGRTVLALGKREGEVKEYRSLVSLWKNGAEFRKDTIAVNNPLEQDGYMFYQADFNPEDLTYSGILVVSDPGLSIVYAGFILLSLGVIWTVYIKPRIIARKARSRS